MYTEIRYTNPSLGFRGPAEARRWVTANAPFLPPEIFNRDDNGHTLSTQSPFTVEPCRDGVCLSAFGEAATRTLIGLEEQLGDAFMQAAPGGDISFRRGIAGLTTGPRLFDYAIHDFVLENNAARSRLYAEHLATEGGINLTAIAEKLFHEAINRRCLLIDAEVPEEAIFGGFQASRVRPVHGGDQPLLAVELRFRSNVIFSGPWHIGRLANKGCGRVRMFKGIRPAPMREAFNVRGQNPVCVEGGASAQ